MLSSFGDRISHFETHILEVEMHAQYMPGTGYTYLFGSHVWLGRPTFMVKNDAQYMHIMNSARGIQVIALGVLALPDVVDYWLEKRGRGA